jgi:hypothetical protein
MVGYSSKVGRVALVVFLALPLACAQPGDYRAKASFLVAFPNFVERPDAAFSSEKAPLLICVFGDFSFRTSLAETARASSIRGRRIDVRWVHKEQELRSCQIVFVSRSESSHYTRIFKSIQGVSILTVGETDGFLSSGGAFVFSSSKTGCSSKSAWTRPRRLISGSAPLCWPSPTMS